MSTKNQGNNYYHKVFSENSDNSYFGKYGTDIVITGGVITLIVLTYLYFEYSKKISYYNHAVDKEGKPIWAKEKCKPYILPISGMIRREPGMTSYESTYYNFQKCSEDGFKSGAWKFFNPLYIISSSISILLSTILGIITTIKTTMQTIAHYLLDRFKRDKRKIDEIEREVTSTIAEHIYKRLHDSVVSLKNFFIGNLKENSDENDPRGVMGLWKIAQKNLGIILRQYHIDLFQSIAKDISSAGRWLGVKILIIAWMAAIGIGAVTGLFTGGVGFIIGLIVASALAATSAALYDIYLRERKKAIKQKKDVLLMYDLMKPGLRDAVGNYKGLMPAIPPSFSSAARSDRDYSFLFGPLDFSVESEDPKVMWKLVKDAEDRIKNEKYFDIVDPDKMKPVHIGPRVDESRRFSTGGGLITDAWSVDAGLGHPYTAGKDPGQNAKITDYNNRLITENPELNTEGGNIGCIKRIEPMPYYMLEFNRGYSQIIYDYLNIKLKAIQQELKTLEENSGIGIDNEQKDDLKERIKNLEYAVNAPLFRGQGNSNGKESEHDLFSARFYKNYGQNALIFTFQDYFEKGHTQTDYYGGYNPGGKPYGNRFSADHCKTAMDWYERVVKGLETMNSLQFKNNSIIPLGQNSSNEYQILVYNIKWESNKSRNIYKPSEYCYQPGLPLREEPDGRGKMTWDRKKQAPYEDELKGVYFENQGQVVEYVGGIHKLFERSYNKVWQYGPWSSGAWLSKQELNTDAEDPGAFEIFLFTPNSIRLYKDSQLRTSYASGLITFELTKVRIAGKPYNNNILGRGVISKYLPTKRAVFGDQNYDKWKNSNIAGWLKRDLWNPENGPSSLTNNQLKLRNKQGLISSGKCESDTYDKEYCESYFGTGDSDWNNESDFSAKRFSREHVDIIIKSIYENYENGKEIFPKYYINDDNHYGRFKVNFADWIYNENASDNVLKYLEDKEAGKSLRIVQDKDLLDVNNNKVPSNKMIENENAPYWVSTYDKSKLKRRYNDKDRKNAENRWHEKNNRFKEAAYKIGTSSNNKESFQANEEIEDILIQINEDKNERSFFNFKNIFNFGKNKENMDNEGKIDEMQAAYDKLQKGEKKLAEQYNIAAVDLMIEEYKFRADYTTSDDFGVFCRKDINGSYASGYDRQTWIAEVSRRHTNIEKNYSSNTLSNANESTGIDHGINKLKFGFLNPVFFDGDQRSTAACFGKNTKIQLKSGKKINIQNLNIGDKLFNNSTVTAISKHLYQRQNIYNINDVIITENHGVIYESKIIPAYYHPKAKLQDVYKYKYLYCFSTDTKRLTINNIDFCDWDEVSDKEIEYLASLGKIKKKIQHSFIHQEFDSGFIPSTIIELNDGNKIKIEDLKIGDMLKNNIKVLGIIHIDIENIQLYKHYVYDKVFYGTKNIVYATKKSYSKQKIKNVSTYFEHNNQKRQEWTPNKNIKQLYHVITDNNYIFIDDVPFAHYNDSLEVFLPNN